MEVWKMQPKMQGMGLGPILSEKGCVIAGSFKSQLIDYFRGAITSWELVEGSLWQFYDNET